MKALIIGNGFDLNLGLPTSYNDFVDSAEFKRLLLKENKLAEHLSEIKKEKRWVDIEHEFIDYSRTGNNASFYSEYISLKKALIQYLKNIDYSKIDEKSKAYSLLSNNLKASGANVILNFNYTDAVESIVRRYSNKLTQVIYIHGEIVSFLVEIFHP